MRIFAFAAAAAAIPAAALAQPAAPREEVTVVAPYYVHQRTLKDDIRSPVLAVTVEKRVSYADLDLSKPGDADKFRSRISEAATSLCSQMDRLYPPAAYVPVSRQNCAKAAADQAMFTVNMIIDFWRM